MWGAAKDEVACSIVDSTAPRLRIQYLVLVRPSKGLRNPLRFRNAASWSSTGVLGNLALLKARPPSHPRCKVLSFCELNANSNARTTVYHRTSLDVH